MDKRTQLWLEGQGVALLWLILGVLLFELRQLHPLTYGTAWAIGVVLMAWAILAVAPRTKWGREANPALLVFTLTMWLCMVALYLAGVVSGAL